MLASHQRQKHIYGLQNQSLYIIWNIYIYPKSLKIKVKWKTLRRDTNWNVMKIDTDCHEKCPSDAKWKRAVSRDQMGLRNVLSQLDWSDGILTRGGNCHRFANNISKLILFYKSCSVRNQVSLNFALKGLTSSNPLSEPLMANSMVLICPTKAPMCKISLSLKAARFVFRIVC